MNKFLTVVFILISLSVFGQKQYEIKGFSKKYKGKLTIDKDYENKVFKKGTISILNSKTNQEIIAIESDELIFDIDKHEKGKTNISYEEQSLIVCQDFNFDGQKDLAVMDGQNSCYHGPSFQVYLTRENSLIHSPEFTELAQEYCGLFDVDYENETIHNMTKSGCCWHEFSTFKMIDGIPKPVLIIEDDAMNFPFQSTTTTTIEWNGEERKESFEIIIDLQQEGVTEIMSFKLAKNKKRVVVFTTDDQYLNYALVKAHKVIEFLYPIGMRHNNLDFQMNEAENKLTFENKDAVYQIYQNRTQEKSVSVGILVRVKGKVYDLKGDINSLKGTLGKIPLMKLDNVIK